MTNEMVAFYSIVHFRRRKAYSYWDISEIMGKRNCAFEGCNALEFRTSGYCLRHKDDHSWIAPPEPALEVVAAFKGEVEKEEEFLGGLGGWVIAISVGIFPPILFVLRPIYIFKRLTSKEDSEPDPVYKNCVIDGCNAMTYQESEYCLRHQPSMLPRDETGKLDSNEEDEKKWWDVE